MAFELEKLLRITDENSDSGVSILQGSGAVSGTADQNAADQGSYYFDRDGSGAYYKHTAGSGADKWVRSATVSDLASFTWRQENPYCATGDVAPATGATIDLVANPFGDDDGTKIIAADFTVGDHIVFGVGGTPKLMKVSVIAGDDITVVDADIALNADDKLLCKHYLPDSGDDQEKQAILHYDGSAIFKISDFNWDVATGINISSGYTAGNGSVSSADTVESSIEKLDGNQQDIQSASGLSQGDVDYGTFTGALLADNQTSKQLFQALESKDEAQDLIITEIDANVDDLITLSGVAENSTDLGTFTGSIIPDSSTNKGALQALETEIESLDGQLTPKDAVTTEVILDEFLVDDFLACEYEIEARLDSAPGRMQAVKFFMGHNGHAGADATATDKTVYGKLKIGANFDVDYSVALTGTGAAQKMQLKVSASSAISVRGRKECIKAQGL